MWGDQGPQYLTFQPLTEMQRDETTQQVNLRGIPRIPQPALKQKPSDIDRMRKDPSESPAQFATRALSQLEEGLKAHKAKYGNLRHPRPEELK